VVKAGGACPDKAHPAPASHTSWALAAVSVVSHICTPRPKHAANAHLRGSAFLKQWMEYLEEHADLRYPNLADVYTGAE
jgi:hypothetical protein